jgi:uncharacterized protein (DUF4415 family)
VHTCAYNEESARPSSGTVREQTMKREYDFGRGRRGAVLKVAPGKTRITIRLDNEVLDWFRAQVHAAGGGSYQALINAALKEHTRAEREPLEKTIRRVLREELTAVTKRAANA